MKSDYSTMKEIGEEFGVTSHKIGKVLKDLGYRTDKGRPSDKAFEECLVNQRWTDDSFNYLWAWDREKTIGILEKAGLRKVNNDGQS